MEEELLARLDKDRGHLLFVTCLVTGLYHSIPPNLASEAMHNLRQQVEETRVALLNGASPQALLDSFEFHASHWKV